MSVSFVDSEDVAQQHSLPDSAYSEASKHEQAHSRTMTSKADVVAAADAFCATQSSSKSLDMVSRSGYACFGLLQRPRGLLQQPAELHCS